MIIWIAREGEAHGPYTAAAVMDYLSSDQLSPQDCAWVAGMENWRPLGEILCSGKDWQIDGEADLAENAAKIRRLIQNGRGQHACDLVRGLDDPDLYGELLKGCSIRESDWGEGQVDLPPEIDCPDGIALFLLCVGRRPVDAPAPSIRSIKKLYVYQELDVDGLEPLSAFENLESLELCCEKLNSDAFGFLADLPNLRELKLNELQPCDNLNFLEPCDGLEELALSGFRGTDLGSVAHMPSLTSLSLNEFSHLAELPPLKSMDSLKGISLADCGLLKEVDALLGAPKLERVDFGRCTQLESVEGLAKSKSLNLVNLDSCEELHDLGPLDDLAESIDISLHRCPALPKLLGRLLRAAKVGRAVMQWNGSGDDGYCEGCLYDSEGNEFSPPNAELLNDMIDSLLTDRLPGGAEINSGSDAELSLDVRKGTGNWIFSWSDEERSQAADLIDHAEAEGFDRLTVALRFAFHEGEGYSDDALAKFWEQQPYLDALFTEDEQWVYLSEVEFIEGSGQDGSTPKSTQLDFKAFFTEFVEADSPGRYNGGSIFQETLAALFEGDLDQVPKIVVRDPIILTIDAVARELMFGRGNHQCITEIGILSPDDEYEFKLE